VVKIKHIARHQRPQTRQNAASKLVIPILFYKDILTLRQWIL
jgi:hypothetical protein